MTTTTTVGRRARRAFGRKGFLVMSAAPQPAQPQRNPKVAGDFESFVDGALRDHVVGTGGLPLAADVEPRELLRYAAGNATDDERTSLEDFVKRSRWAYDRVVALVRSNRPGEAGLRNQIAKRLLNANNRTKAVQIVGQAILEVEGVKTSSLEDAWKSIEKTGSPETRAACLIGLGRQDEARRVLEDQKSQKPVWKLLERVSAAAMTSGGEAADDAVLLAVLDVFPTL
ncbi:MAG: hypothetical protein ACAI25_12630 [Planctomycetota bacterium]